MRARRPTASEELGNRSTTGRLRRRRLRLPGKRAPLTSSLSRASAGDLVLSGSLACSRGSAYQDGDGAARGREADQPPPVRAERVNDRQHHDNHRRPGPRCTACSVKRLAVGSTAVRTVGHWPESTGDHRLQRGPSPHRSRRLQSGSHQHEASGPMTDPGSRPPGFTAIAGLILWCPRCGEVAEDRGSGRYRCRGVPQHDFKAGRCELHRTRAFVYRGVLWCRDPAHGRA